MGGFFYETDWLTWQTEIICIPLKCGGKSSNGFHIRWILGTHGNWKNQNPGSHFGATSYTALPVWPSFEVNGLNYMWFLAGSSKMAPWILIFLIVLGAEYLSFVKSIALTLFGYIISVLASVLTYIFFIMCQQPLLNLWTLNIDVILTLQDGRWHWILNQLSVTKTSEAS